MHNAHYGVKQKMQNAYNADLRTVGMACNCFTGIMHISGMHFDLTR